MHTLTQICLNDKSISAEDLRVGDKLLGGSQVRNVIRFSTDLFKVEGESTTCLIAEPYLKLKCHFPDLPRVKFDEATNVFTITYIDTIGRYITSKMSIKQFTKFAYLRQSNNEQNTFMSVLQLLDVIKKGQQVFLVKFNHQDFELVTDVRLHARSSDGIRLFLERQLGLDFVFADTNYFCLEAGYICR